MDLQSLVRETKPLIDNVLVVRFTNGFDVAYEKQSETEFRVYVDEDSEVKERKPVGSRTTVKYSLLPAQRCGILPHNCKEINNALLRFLASATCTIFSKSSLRIISLATRSSSECGRKLFTPGVSITTDPSLSKTALPCITSTVVPG